MQIQNLVIDENGMAFDPTLGSSYQLGGSAKEIIDLIKEGKGKAEIIEILAKRYNIDQAQLFIDISDFFAKLKVYGLVQ